MSSKKGMETINVVITLLILGVILIFYFYVTGKIGGYGKAGTAYQGLGSMLEICRDFGSSGEHDYNDVDGDGLPDFCDNCPGISNDKIDSDKDLYPDDCDTDKDNPLKFPKYAWDGKLPKEER